ncbi:MAG: hypothetical protein IV100_07540 [Myxococcales bacterium]|nr:hypothetical protein [Myxococcales bacterium]
MGFVLMILSLAGSPAMGPASGCQEDCESSSLGCRRLCTGEDDPGACREQCANEEKECVAKCPAE